MHVSEIMTRDVGGIVPETTLKEAAHEMESLGVGFLPVCDGERIVGVITDRDIVTRAVGKGADPATAVVKDFMTSKVFATYEDKNVNDAAAIMKRKKIRRLVVLNGQKILSGVISLGDLAVYTGKKTVACQVLVEVSKPARPRRGV